MSAHKDLERWLNTLPKLQYSNEIESNHSTNKRRKALQESGSLSDTSLICGGKTIRCHRFVLAENSPVFETMFTSGFRENEGAEPVEIKGISYDLLMKILTFLYSGTIELEPEDVIKVLEFSDMYDFEPLGKVCATYLLEHIDTKVAVTIWKTLNIFHLNESVNKAMIYCIDHFSCKVLRSDPDSEAESTDNGNDLALSTNDKYLYFDNDLAIPKSFAFLEAEMDEICQLLAHPDLEIRHENLVFETIYLWILHDPENRISCFDDLVKTCLRLEHVDPGFVLDTVRRTQQTHLPENMHGLLFSFLAKLNKSVEMTEIKPLRTRIQQKECLVAIHVVESKLLAGYHFKTERVVHIHKKVALRNRIIQKILVSKTNIYDLREKTLIKLADQHDSNIIVTLPKAYQRLISLPNGKLFALYRGTNYCMRLVELESEHSFVCLNYIKLRYDGYFAELCVPYNEYIIFFSPTKSEIMLVSTTCSSVYPISTAFAETGTVLFQPKLVSYGSIAFLIHEEVIEVIFLDRLLERCTALISGCDVKDVDGVEKEEKEKSPDIELEDPPTKRIRFENIVDDHDDSDTEIGKDTDDGIDKFSINLLDEGISKRISGPPGESDLDKKQIVVYDNKLWIFEAIKVYTYRSADINAYTFFTSEISDIIRSNNQHISWQNSALAMDKDFQKEYRTSRFSSPIQFTTLQLHYD